MRLLGTQDLMELATSLKYDEAKEELISCPVKMDVLRYFEQTS